MTTLANRYDFVLLFDVSKGNPRKLFAEPHEGIVAVSAENQAEPKIAVICAKLLHQINIERCKQHLVSHRHLPDRSDCRLRGTLAFEFKVKLDFVARQFERLVKCRNSLAFSRVSLANLFKRQA